MATLKSMELQGNKLSFANFISNLSPCDTPFASMIGKESIDQVQYSWQTDRLAPATNTAFEEGSQAEMQPRAATEVIHNFTSTLRAVASVSDTVQSMSTYGRKKEMNYQLSKAGKELKRDLEYALLHNVNGLSGTPTRASNFAGFEGLVAGLGVHDADTNAVVHMESEIAAGKIDLQDIFKITTNLFIAGSKADKIMFHPKFASSFSDLLGSNANTPHVHRMFEGLDDRMNLQVKKIKDPLGRVYTLIPNRFMPVDKIYFFTEDDWTQTILRSPSTTKLAKQGSSERYMIEMEVGLRHRNPYASGILSLKEVRVTNELSVTTTEMTAGVNDEVAVSAKVLVDGVSHSGTEVSWHTSNPDIVSFAQGVTTVTGAQGLSLNQLRAGNRLGTAVVWCVSKGVKSSEYLVQVRAPIVELTVSEKNPAMDAQTTLSALVKKFNGAEVGAGVRVDWYANPRGNLELTEAFTLTDSTGTASVDAVNKSVVTTLVQCSTSRFNSNAIYLNYVPVISSLDLDVTPNTFAVGENTQVVAMAIDHEGNPIGGVTITLTNNNPELATLSEVSGETDDTGTFETDIQGLAVGVGSLSASSGNVVLSGEVKYYVGTGGAMQFEINPNPVKVGVETSLTASLTGMDGSPLRGANITFVATPEIPGLLSGATDINGVWEDKVTSTVPGEFEVTATARDFNLRKTVTLTIDA